MHSWLRSAPQGSFLYLHIHPGSSRSEIVGLHADRLKIKIKAPPEDGKANKCLIEFLSEVLKISKNKIQLVQGESSRQKTLLVELSPDEIILLVSEHF